MPRHVLIVDDQADLLLLMRRSLESEGYRVTQAGDAHAALRAAAAEAPDLVISDVMMPEMDGFTFVEQLRCDPRLTHVPVIFLTAAAAVKEVESRARKLGVDHFLQKPFNPRRLLEAVRGTLERHTQLPQAGTDADAADPASLRHLIDTALAGERAGGHSALVTDRTGATRVRDAWALAFRACAAAALQGRERCALLVAQIQGEGGPQQLAAELAPLWGAHHVACWLGEKELVVFAPGEDRAGAAALARQLHERLAARGAPGGVRAAVTSWSTNGAPGEGRLDPLAEPPAA